LAETLVKKVVDLARLSSFLGGLSSSLSVVSFNCFLSAQGQTKANLSQVFNYSACLCLAVTLVTKTA